LTQTPLASHILSSEERIEASNNRHPLKRIGQPEDIAQSAAFLLGDESSWMTGQIIGVDGGLSTVR
jgi:NAD(P)-dependent dehydrogenase (short-subunit alcohol dehydrogenase family)